MDIALRARIHLASIYAYSHHLYVAITINKYRLIH